MINLPRQLAPSNWNDFYGHEYEKHIILRSLTGDALLFPNAFYVAGDTGTGKTTIVNLIIRSLLCYDPQDYQLGDRVYPKVNPCGQCESCRNIKDFRSAESSYTNIKLIQDGKGDGDSNNTAVNEALRLSMTPPININPGRKDYRFLIFDEWQLFDKRLRQRVLLRAEDGLRTSIFIFVTMAEEELGEKRRTALVSRGIDVTLNGFTEEDITNYLLTEVNPKLPEGLPRINPPEAAAIAKESDGSLRMALCHYGKLFRYDYGLDFIQKSTAQHFLNYTNPEDRVVLWQALNERYWPKFDEQVQRFSNLYSPTQLDRLALDLIEDVTSAMRANRGNQQDQLYAINMLLQFASNHRAYRLSDFLTVLGGMDLGVAR